MVRSKANYRRFQADQDSKPLNYEYRILFSDNSNFTGGYLLNSIKPGANLSGTFSGGSGKELYVWKDSNPIDIGVNGNGFDEALVTSSGDVNKIQARQGGSGTFVDFAIDYGPNGLNIPKSAFAFARFDAVKGLTAIANYLWHDEYDLDQAGSPYTQTYGADGSINPPGNIYELDTTRLAVIPLPGAAFLFAPALMGLWWARRRQQVARPELRTA